MPALWNQSTSVPAVYVGITGATGLVGAELAGHLAASGHTPVPIVRTEPGPGEIGWDPAAGHLRADDLAGLDAVVHLAGAGIGDRRWNDEHRRLLVDSRVATTELMADRLARLGTDGPRVLISGSAIGFYGNRGDEVLDERSSGGTGFLPDLCRRWEAATATAETAGIRVAHIRTGIVLSRRGGVLAKMLPLFRFGIGGRFGDGQQWMSWITIDDEVGAITHLLTSSLSGPVNLTAPSPTTNRRFTSALATALRRPAVVPVPAFGPRLLLGRDMADALLFEGQRVHPSALVDDGFEFEHADIDGALAAVLGRR